MLRSITYVGVGLREENDGIWNDSSIVLCFSVGILVVVGGDVDAEVEVTVLIDEGAWSVDQALVVGFCVLDLDLLEDEMAEEVVSEVSADVVPEATDVVLKAGSDEDFALLVSAVETIVGNVLVPV